MIVRRPEDVPRHGQTVKLPHKGKREPRKELHDRQLLHSCRHLAKRVGDLLGDIADDRTLGVLSAKTLDVLGREFVRRKYRPQDRREKRDGSDDKRDKRRIWNAAFHNADHAKPRQNVGQSVCQRRADADKERLHYKPERTLLFGQLVADKGAKRFHRDVDRRVHYPEQARGHPHRRRVWHQYQTGAGQNGPDQKERATPAEPRPRPVAHRPDDRLYQQAGQRPGEPEVGQRTLIGAEVLIDRRHIGHLQPPAKLNAQKAEAHIPDLPKCQVRFVLHTILFRPRVSPPIAAAFRMSAGCYGHLPAGHCRADRQTSGWRQSA